ncbi:MAG TPA: low specificity L-threonine aldolase [Gemmatimonadales bacterium]|nr:low specificity L-threonine aldolase [Gemmatimonadales bacterium]
MKDFASDNTAGVHPLVLDALSRANAGRAPAYGDDEVTARAAARVREQFGPEVEVFFVWGGTAANVLGLSTMLAPYQGVICTDIAHIEEDECAAPERFTGSKLLPVRSRGGKLTGEDVAARVQGVNYPHQVMPRVVSVTQATEYGTVYTPAELRAISDAARAHGLRVHMDGARLANAAAGLGLPLRALTADVGVDVLSFGGTKNGGLAAEAVVLFDPALARDFPALRKQGMQLASKMRFVSAQVEALLTDDLWLRNARCANAMARRLAERASAVEDITITQPVEANAVFAIVPAAAVQLLQQTFRFYVWNERTSEVRWMTSFDTSEPDVDAFADAIGSAVRAARVSGGR